MLQEIPKDFLIEENTRDATYSMKNLHYHSVYEFIFMEKGECSVQINRNLYHIHSGTFIIIPKLCPHKTVYRSKSQNKRTVLYFTEYEINRLSCELSKENPGALFQQKVLQVSQKRIPYVRNLLKQIKYELCGVDELSLSIARTYFEELFLFLLRCRLYAAQPMDPGDSSSHIIQQVIQYIDEHYAEDLSLTELAKQFGMSESSLSKKFKAYSGFRFKKYLSDVRIREAKKYLLHTTKQISEIAILCGFNTGNFFGDAFKKATGISPSLYRKRL